ncbi:MULTISPECIES: hypothetical protein [Prochlorococcus]|uniref:Uncharacterized protein n=1 Tax=Prochlorococcus marinus str. MIT 9116 TaxID=167544 RepID=A0A0A1ZVZ3_PROMR|nr:hypothetical protein [Prochlorococcus marinus]KGF89823.1 hypothetical protein EU92_1614 [Prochlorococcus marinus str. MIT 9107]KGF92328.1 hypothetical protein EU93_0592 [Prochlorococcus marinus str. MIT 9116]KGF92646.1 hypothetical protein EU94_1644 [Prochlorococcus marinus str. MIT 9123]
MKRLVFSVLASSSMLIAGSVIPVIAEDGANTSVIPGGCANSPDVGTRFKTFGPGQWKLSYTVQRLVTSKNERKIDKAKRKSDFEAQKGIARFIDLRIKGGSTEKTGDDEKYVVGINDVVTEDSLEEFQSFAEEFSSETDALLSGLMKLGECNDIGERVKVTWGIKSDSIAAAKDAGASIAKPAQSGSNSGQITNDEYRPQMGRGYSGYGNFDDF